MAMLKLCVVVTFVFFMAKCSPALALSSFTFIRSHFKSFLLSVSKMVSSAYLQLLIFLPPIFSPPSSEPSELFMYVLHTDETNRKIKCTLV